MVESMRRRTALLTAGLVATASTVFLAEAEPTPVAAQPSTYTDDVNVCHSTGSVGVYSNHSNQQECIIGFFACVGTDTTDFGAYGGLPAGTVGVIMTPWGDTWNTTGGNYGYVGNVCNGNAGMSSVITYTHPSLWDAYTLSVDPSFANHLRLIQQQCAGRCQAVSLAYYTPLQLWDDNSLHLRDMDHHSLEYHLLSFYIANGPLYWDGYTVNTNGQGSAMGAGGYGGIMSQTVLSEQGKNDWEEFKEGMMHSLTEIVGDFVQAGIEFAFIMLVIAP